MADLTPQEVQTLAKAAGVNVLEEDLTEITHRLNVLISGIEDFSHPDLDKVDPLPFHPLEEVGSG